MTLYYKFIGTGKCVKQQYQINFRRWLMPYHIGIDISKYKHNCFIATDAGAMVKEFTFDNNKEGFTLLYDKLLKLGDSSKIKIGLESTGHYGTNLKSFLSSIGYTYIEFNPFLTSQFSKALSLRKTKTDKVDARMISRMLGTVDYEALHTRFYHIEDLKELVRQRDVYMTDRSTELIHLTNILDKVFPEYKPFFNNILGAGALYILKKYKTKERISKLTTRDYESIKSKTRRFTYPKFTQLKQLAIDSIGIQSKSLNYLLQLSIHHIEYISSLLDELDQEITRLYQMTDSKLSTLPGMGVIQAATIYAEIGLIDRFPSASQLTAHAGYDVRIIQSGQTERFGHIVKRGSSLLRKAIWNYALPSIRFMPIMTEYYHKKRNEGKHHKVVLTHICRKLIRLIYHIESNKLDYNPSLSK